MTFNNVILDTEKKIKVQLWTTTKIWFNADIPRLLRRAVRRSGLLSYKSKPNNQAWYANKLKKESRNFLLCNQTHNQKSSKEKAECSSAYSSQGWTTMAKIIEAVRDTQRKKNFVSTDMTMHNQSGCYRKTWVYYGV